MTQIRWDELSEARQLARLGKRLSRAAQTRLQWMLFYFFNGRNAHAPAGTSALAGRPFIAGCVGSTATISLPWKGARIGRATYVGPPGQPQQLNVCSRCANNIPAGARTSSRCCSLV